MSIHKTFVVLVLSFTSLASIGCGAATAHHVRRGSFSGEMVVNGPVVDSTSTAYAMMSEHCRGPFRIVDEDEGLALATRDASSGKADGDLVEEIPGTRIHYVCTRAEAL